MARRKTRSKSPPLCANENTKKALSQAYKKAVDADPKKNSDYSAFAFKHLAPIVKKYIQENKLTIEIIDFSKP